TTPFYLHHYRVPPTVPTRRSSDLLRINGSARTLARRDRRRAIDGPRQGERDLSKLPALYSLDDAHRALGLCSERGCGSRRTGVRSEEHTSELQSRGHLVCRLLLAK